MEKFDEELVHEFLVESKDLLVQCSESLSNFSSSGDVKCFEKFGLFIDRVMGASYTMGFNLLGDLAKLGKQIGYKSSQLEDMEKLLSSQSVLSQLTKEMNKILKVIQMEGRDEAFESSVLVAKLEKANNGLGDIRASVKI
jgi:hypothetical protein